MSDPVVVSATEPHYTPKRVKHDRRYKLRHREKIAAQARARYEKSDRLIIPAKSKPCADCTQSYPTYVMDFDHVRGEKKFDIARGRTRCSLTRLQQEIDKCDVVCANCHRERTYQRKVAANG